MTSRIIEISESVFGGEILTIETIYDAGNGEEVMEIYESRGFLNGLKGNPILQEGDLVDFDLKWNPISRCNYAVNIKLVK